MGLDNEEIAVRAYEMKSNAEVDVCGLFISTQFPFLGSPEQARQIWQLPTNIPKPIVNYSVFPHFNPV